MKAKVRASLVILTICLAELLPAQTTLTRTRTLLAKMQRGHTETRMLASAFRTGDDNIDDLIALLNDSDENVRLNAQVVIRYLGNKRGMEALAGRLKAGQTKGIAGPVPIPLSEWDFDWIEGHLLCSACHLAGWGVPEYGYALLLDDSPRAKQTLSTLMEKFSANWLPARAATRFGDESPLERELLKHAFWLSSTEQKASTAKMLSVATNSDKALFEVHVNQGALAEKWFHVVAIRELGDWRIISVTMVSQS